MENTITEVKVLGRRIHELRGGKGRPLLYLHSAAGEAMWLPHLLSLSEHFEVHAPAHPGFLTSEGIEQIHNIEDYVLHYQAYLDEMGWDSVDVVGLSLGGWIAAELAARAPARVNRLVLANAVGIWVKEAPIADIFALDTRFPDRLRNLFFFDVDCAAAQMMQAPSAEVELPDELVINFMNAMAATAKVGWNPLLHNPQLERLLGRVTAKTLCLWSANDKVVPTIYGDKYARLIPNAHLQLIPECGHMMPFEKPNEFVSAVTRFLA